LAVRVGGDDDDTATFMPAALRVESFQILLALQRFMIGVSDRIDGTANICPAVNLQKIAVISRILQIAPGLGCLTRHDRIVTGGRFS
jgi:hypothetical protein